MKRTIALAILPLFLASCSVFMAAKKEGVSLEELSQCKTRTCLITKGVTPIETTKDEAGVITEETYQVQKPRGSAARAVMHGLLDVATWGLWEVAGTPIEGTMMKKDYYSIKVTYENGENIKHVLLMQ